MRSVLAAAAALGLAAAASAQEPQGGIAFRDPLNNEPLQFKHKPDQAITPAVERFRQTGESPYVGDAAATEAGQKVYDRLCQACHLKDGTGRIGASLVDDQWRHARDRIDVGMFEIIYAGGAGAMQAFGNRLTQDEILKVIAYIHKLRAQRR
jgi:cytochrome c-L